MKAFTTLLMLNCLSFQVGLSHEQLAKFPSVLLAKRLTIRDRHNFLQKLGRNQYDPTYVDHSVLFYQKVVDKG